MTPMKRGKEERNRQPRSAYSTYSYWLETCEDDLSPRPRLEGSVTVDVAVLGAGFTGLWTAYYLLQHNPSLRIAIVERDIAGFGASGRNGGWCSSLLSLSPKVAIERFGLDSARELQLAMYGSVREVSRVIQKEALDVHWVQGGTLEVALGQQDIPGLETSLQIYRELGVDTHYELLNADETNERVRIHGVQGSLYSRDSGVLHPGRLVRQLARAVENCGATIHEQTEVLDFQEGSCGCPAQLITSSGVVSANLAVVLAGEAYLSGLKKLHRRLVPIYSLMVLTEPLTPDQWASIGWEGQETVGSNRLSINYLQRTADGRILFGGRGQPYHFASKIKDAYDKHRPTHERLKTKTIQWFPSISGIRFTHDWGGPLGVTRDWTPNIQYSPRTKIACAWGYVGDGVATSNLAGRILGDLISGTRSAATDLPIVQHDSPQWEPEPFRWAGIRYVQSGLERIDRQADSTGIRPQGDTLIERLSRH